MRKGDKILTFLLVFIAAIWAVVFVLSYSKNPGMLVVKSDGRIVKEIRLTPHTNITFSVKSKEGHLTVEIKNGKARVIQSTCRDKLCIREGWISRAGESITCLPNRITISITGERRGKVDTTTY